jgi:SWI/SNF-related matrix-associated actin-dependent regulator of chromatin subfamily A3
MLYDSLVLRRSKDILELPDPLEDVRPLDFSPEERVQYDRTMEILGRCLRNQANFQQGQLFTIDQAMTDGTTSKFSLFHAMMQLRLLCNHGTFQNLFSWKKQQCSWDTLQEREALITNAGPGRERVCDGCRNPQPQLGSIWPGRFVERCPHVLCSDCLNDSRSLSEGNGEWVSHCPICQRFGTSFANESSQANWARVDDDGDMVVDEDGENNGHASDEGVEVLQNSSYFRPYGTSTKVNALMEDLRKGPEGAKR